MKLTACATVAELLEMLAENKPQLNAIHLSAAMRLLVTLKPSAAVAADAAGIIWDLMRPLLSDAPTRVMANTIWSAVKLQLPVGSFRDLYEYCFWAFLRQSESAEAQELANVVYALCSSEVDVLQALLLQGGVLDQLVKMLVIRVQQQGQQERAQERLGVQAVANTIWSVAKLGGLDVIEGDLLLRLQGVFVGRMLPYAKPQEVCNVLYAAALTDGLEITQQQLEQLVWRFMACLGPAAPQAVSSSIWAVACLQAAGRVQLQPQEAKAFFSACTEALIAKVASCSCQDISLLLWSAASMGYALPAGQLQLLLMKFLEKVRYSPPLGPTPQSVANACWAVAMMVGGKWRVQPLLQPPVMSLVGHFSAMLQQAKAQEVASVLWAASTLGYNPRAVLQVWRPKGEEWKEFNLLAVANTMWALARLGWEDEGLVRDLMGRALECVGELKGRGQQLRSPSGPKQGTQQQQQEPAVLRRQQKQHPSGHWSPTPLPLSSRSSQKAAEVAAPATAGTSDGLQECCNIAWAVSLLNMPSLVPDLQPLAATCFGPGVVLHSLGYAQWYQVHMWLTDNTLLGGRGLEDLGCSKEQLQLCREEWLNNLARSQSSMLQTHVGGMLRKVAGVEVLGTEQLDEVDGLFSIDIVARAAGVLLAVEVDGPQHFLLPDYRVTGETRYRQRALRRRGYAVMTVAGHDWRAVGGEREQVEFLRWKVKVALREVGLDVRADIGVAEVEGTAGAGAVLQSDSSSAGGVVTSSTAGKTRSGKEPVLQSSSGDSGESGSNSGDSTSSRGMESAMTSSRSSKKKNADRNQQGSGRPQSQKMSNKKRVGGQEQGFESEAGKQGDPERAVLLAAAGAQQARAAIRKAGW